MKKSGGQLQRKINIKWSSNFAYAIGLITSDGNLSKDERHIGFISKDEELILKFKQSLSLTNRVTRNARGGETEKKYYCLRFGDKIFYQFLNSIGLTSAKSKTIQSVTVPNTYFADFVRGVFDGDGSFYTFWDKRWPNSFCYQLSFASASKNFLVWLKARLDQLYGTKGFIRPGAGVWTIRYTKKDTRILYQIMYHTPTILRLDRKYNKITAALAFDAGLAHR